MSLLPLWFVAVFLLGLFAGGFVNFCTRRLPYERSLLWPGPRCLKCLQPYRWFDCLPVIGYVLSGGRCRSCQTTTTLRDPIVELFTGVLFVALFALVVGVLPVPLLDKPRWIDPSGGEVIPLRAAVFFLHHAILLCLLLTASLCDLADMEIPFSLTLFGTAVGLVLATLFPWPYHLQQVSVNAQNAWPPNVAVPLPGDYPALSLYSWPFGEPNDVKAWVGDGSLSGFLTGLAGAAAGTAILRAIGFLFKLGRGIEGMGVGDADLMMMAGAFLGWQMVVVAFFVAVAPGLLFAVIHLIVRRSQALPFGPSLALGVVLTVLYWPVLGNYVGPLFFMGKLMFGIFGGGAVLLLMMAFMLWFFRWMMGDEGDEDPSQVPTPPAPPAPNEEVK